MIAHISWIGMFDYIAIAIAGLIVLAAALTLWKDSREQEREQAELIDLAERLRRNEERL